MKLNELYTTVTQNIIRDLEAGVAPWTKPWKDGKAAGIMPHNGATHRAYHGINVMLLWAERETKGYTTPNWMTYRQALALGGQVRAGEKSTTVVFTKKLRLKDKDTEEEKTVGMLRTYAVFNSDQIDGLNHIADSSKMVPARESTPVNEPFQRRLSHAGQQASTMTSISAPCRIPGTFSRPPTSMATARAICCGATTMVTPTSGR